MNVNKIRVPDLLSALSYFSYVDIFLPEGDGLRQVYTGELKDLWSSVNIHYLNNFYVKIVHVGLVDDRMALSIEMAKLEEN